MGGGGVGLFGGGGRNCTGCRQRRAAFCWARRFSSVCSSSAGVVLNVKVGRGVSVMRFSAEGSEGEGCRWANRTGKRGQERRRTPRCKPLIQLSESECTHRRPPWRATADRKQIVAAGLHGHVRMRPDPRRGKGTYWCTLVLLGTSWDITKTQGAAANPRRGDRSQPARDASRNPLKRNVVARAIDFASSRGASLRRLTLPVRRPHSPARGRRGPDSGHS